MDERDSMMEILKQPIRRMKELESEGRVSSPTEIPVANGVGFAWTLSPETKIVIQCTGPISEKGALVEVGEMSSSGEVTWLLHPTIYLRGEEHNVERLYPMDRPGDDSEAIYYTYKRIFNLISKMVGDPVLE
jgi:hypothetical protein